MEMSAGFHRVRTGVFAMTTFISMMWVVFLCVEIFVLYDRSDVAQRNLVGVLIFINAVTAILLPVLLIFQFRPWLDGARLLFLLSSHFGAALIFTLWQPTFSCPVERSQRQVCRDVNLAILICSWVVPALLVWYSAFLAVTYQMRLQEVSKDPESFEKRVSELPMMVPSRRPSVVPPDSGPPPSDGLISKHRRTPPHVLPRPSSKPLPVPPRPLLQPSQALSYSVPSSSALSSSHAPSATSHFSSRVTSLPPSPRASLPSRYSQSSTSLRNSGNSRNSRPSLTLQVPTRPMSQLPSPATPHPSSRSASRIISALPVRPLPTNDDLSKDSSPRSSGRLSKPAPFIY